MRPLAPILAKQPLGLYFDEQKKRPTTQKALYHPLRFGEQNLMRLLPQLHDLYFELNQMCRQRHTVVNALVSQKPEKKGSASVIPNTPEYKSKEAAFLDTFGEILDLATKNQLPIHTHIILLELTKQIESYSPDLEANRYYQPSKDIQQALRLLKPYLGQNPNRG